MKQKSMLFIYSIAILASVFISSSISYNSSAVSSASMTTDSSITLDIVPANGGIAIDEATINVVTTCRNGYNLTLATPNGSNLYLNGDGTGTAAFTAVNGTSTLADSTNKWGYTLTANASSSTVFSPLSATETTLKTTSQTASQTDIDDTFSIYYGAKADNSITPGSYKMANNGALVYYLTMDASCYTVDITYDGNNADEGTMAAVHSNVKAGDGIDLIASNFSRSGYGFAGWSFDSNAGTKLVDNDSTNNPVVYGPQETVTLPSNLLSYDTDGDGEVKLYAVWIQSQGNLQGWMGCSNLDTATYDSNTGALDLTKNSVTALTDQRDNDTYAVARLADGRCWMIENLRLDNTASNNTDGLLAQNYGTSGIYSYFSGLANPESPWNTQDGNRTANSLYSEDGVNNTINIGTYYFFHRVPRYNHDNTYSRVTDPTTDSAAMYSYGNYYTWSAAIADTDSYTSADHNTTSICPTGWELPVGNTTSDGFGKLDVSMGGTGARQYTATASLRWRRYPANFIKSGAINNSTLSSRGGGGFYWSSTSYSVNMSVVTMLTADSILLGDNNLTKARGSSIRCIASNPTSYILSYDANGGSGAPSSQTTTTNGAAIFTVSNTTPTRSGYTFAGWMDEHGNEAQPNGTFRTKDINTILYARWINDSCNPSATTIGTGNSSTDAVCLQDVKPSMKSSLPTADSSSGTYNLIDARDGQSYTIAKLDDGELWLTKNLNYGSNNDTLLTHYDTDLSSGTTFKAPAITTNFETANTTATSVSPKILTDSTYGGYYSFAAAIAYTKAVYSSASQSVTTSICPKSWDLPTREIYDNLRSISGNNSYAKINAAPYSFIYAGYRNGTSFSSQTSVIRLWTSSNHSDLNGYYTSVYLPSTYNYKRFGEPVRCIASNGTLTIHYNKNNANATGTTSDQINVDINSTIIRSNGYTLDEHIFLGWNTSADGNGTAIAADTPLSSLGFSDGQEITLYAQWKQAYDIQYYGNGADNPNGMGTTNNTTGVKSIRQTNVGPGDSVTLLPSNFKRAGYGFVGWSTDSDAWAHFIDNDASNDPVIYGPMETIVAPAYPSGGTITALYAVWVPAETSGGNPVYLQDFDATACGNLTATSFNSTTGEITANKNSVVALTDKRDNQVYAVARLADGNCWMMENLRLDNQYTMGQNQNDSSIANESLSQGYGGTSGTYGSFVGLANPETTTFWNTPTSNSVYKSSANPPVDTYDPLNNTLEDVGTNSYPGYRIPRYMNNNTNNLVDSTSYVQDYTDPSNPSDSGTNYRTSSNIYSYGNYYNWPAAMANTNYILDRDVSDAAGTSICPYNWHLPSSGDLDRECGVLSQSYGGNGGQQVGDNGVTLSNRIRSFPNSFVYSGRIEGSSFTDRGTGGYYTSRSVSSYESARVLQFWPTFFAPTYSGVNRSWGTTVRCLIAP